jgi:uncharacterized membrane protein HdeD (DUF308 family)
MATTNKRLLISGMLYIVTGICYFIDAIQSHLTLLRIAGLSCFLLLGVFTMWSAFREKPPEKNQGQTN